MEATLALILQIIPLLGPGLAGVEGLINNVIADFSATDQATVRAALDAAKTEADAAQAALDA